MKTSIGQQLLHLIRKDWDHDAVTFLGMALPVILLLHLVGFQVRSSLPIAAGAMAAACLLDIALEREMQAGRREYLAVLPVPPCVLTGTKLFFWLGALSLCTLSSVLIGLSGIDAAMLRLSLTILPRAMHPVISAILEDAAVYRLWDSVQLVVIALGLLAFGIIGTLASIMAFFKRTPRPHSLLCFSLILVFTGLLLAGRFEISVSIPVLFLLAAFLDGVAFLLMTTVFYRSRS